MPIAGSLWIRPFEGGRSRLRRRRQLWVLHRTARAGVGGFAVASTARGVKRSIRESRDAAWKCFLADPAVRGSGRGTHCKGARRMTRWWGQESSGFVLTGQRSPIGPPNDEGVAAYG